LLCAGACPFLMTSETDKQAPSLKVGAWLAPKPLTLSAATL
jgi:hypothetical protein